MGYWGKLIGGMAGFAMGGPFGAIMGAAIGHAADTGAATAFDSMSSVGFHPFGFMHPARIAALLGGRDQLFAIGAVVLSAKLAKADGPVKRVEIDAFKQQFRVPPESVRDVGRLFDQARDSNEGFEPYVDQLGAAFSDNRGMLEDVLAALFNIARADGPVNRAEHAFLLRCAKGFGLDERAWDRARGASARMPSNTSEPEPYGVLGIARSATSEEVRARWKQLMRENHPDSLAARGVPAEFVARANEKVALINAAWDRIKRERAI
ncbi:MAG TPA: TerB family tellurite resistance protein [Acidisphaera sp.]|nr:TerB family tellurite resistance protein [Acidisphaera sp.]